MKWAVSGVKCKDKNDMVLGWQNFSRKGAEIFSWFEQLVKRQRKGKKKKEFKEVFIRDYSMTILLMKQNVLNDESRILDTYFLKYSFSNKKNQYSQKQNILK